MKHVWSCNICGGHRWMPIETAPKDGTRVLLNRFGIPVWEGYYVHEQEPGMRLEIWEKYGPHWTRTGYEDLDFNPTHWMPLPDALEDEE